MPSSKPCTSLRLTRTGMSSSVLEKSSEKLSKIIPSGFSSRPPPSSNRRKIPLRNNSSGAGCASPQASPFSGSTSSGLTSASTSSSLEKGESVGGLSWMAMNPLWCNPSTRMKLASDILMHSATWRSMCGSSPSVVGCGRPDSRSIRSCLTPWRPLFLHDDGTGLMCHSPLGRQNGCGAGHSAERSCRIRSADTLDECLSPPNVQEIVTPEHSVLEVDMPRVITLTDVAHTQCGPPPTR